MLKLRLLIFTLASFSSFASEPVLPALDSCRFDRIPTELRQKGLYGEFVVAGTRVEGFAAQLRIEELLLSPGVEVVTTRDAFGRTLGAEYRLLRVETIEHDAFCVSGVGCGTNFERLESVALCSRSSRDTAICEERCHYAWAYDQPGW